MNDEFLALLTFFACTALVVIGMIAGIVWAYKKHRKEVQARDDGLLDSGISQTDRALKEIFGFKRKDGRN